jgi:Mg-chelatase subunit ChlD
MIKKNKFKIISLITIFFVIGTLISLKSLDVKAKVPDRPDFDMEISASPNPAMVGEDIVVSGKIIPKPFETEIPPKEIVLVLDVSGSMKDQIRGVICNNTGYCEEHNSYNRHYTTKMYELKKAAKNFVEKMKNVPNLKIGIVTYSTNADIRRARINNKDVALIPSNEIYKLNSIIDGLRPDGGTNTGEGMRKATYLLDSSGESNSNANKSIVVMSDGIPTYRTIYEYWNYGRYWDYYRDTSIENPRDARIGGAGSSDDDGLNTEYAKEIGKIINSKGYNAFSIGYGMNDTGNSKMREIQGAMTGLNMNDQSTTDEAKGFFPTSDNAIDSVFNKIADKILDSYPVNNIDLNINFTEDFTLNAGGNIVRLDNVVYKKVSESNGKARYEAEPQSFKFTVKGRMPGVQKIYNKIDIAFPWKNDTIKISPTNSISITIKDNELPSIEAKLISSKEVQVNKNEEFKLQYEIKPDDFIFKDVTNTIPNDVVIVLDVSKDMKEKLTPIKNSLWSKLLNNDTLISGQTQYGLVTVSSQAKQKVDLTKDITNLNEKYIKNIEFDNSNASNIGQAFDEAVDILSRGRQEARKNIIFISMGKVLYNTDSLELLKKQGYNILSLSMDNSKDKDSLYRLHKDLSGKDEDYFNVDNNNYSSIEETLMNLIADRITSTTKYKSYKFKPSLKINLGDNFNVISGIQSINEGVATIAVPEITYNPVGDGKYSSDKVLVEFTISVKEGKIGELNFGEVKKNTMIYNKLKGGIAEVLLETPKVTVREEIKNLTHGLYNGIRNNLVDIQTNANGFEIASGSTVTLGGKFTLTSNKSEFNLNIDSKFEQLNNDDIKIYKVVKNGENISLVELLDVIKTKTSPNNNNFNIKLENLNENNSSSVLENEVVVVYKGKIKEDSKNERFENTIQFTNTSSKVSIFTPNSKDGELPDLF